MKLNFSDGWRGVVAVMACVVGAASLGAVGSDELGLEPVYPHLNPDRTKLLSAAQINEALATLPGWQVKDGVLYKIYVAKNFREAVSKLVLISYPLDHLDHHPEIRNIYGKVYIGFTTYDQGKQVTATDVEAAQAVEAAWTGAGSGGGH